MFRDRYRPSACAIVTALVVALAAGGCSSQSGRDGAPSASGASGESGRYKIGNPYTLKGITYVPHVDYTYDAIGIASWYGEPFHGQATANGETYDMNDLTAAHKTLPLPSLVEVTNLDNGRTIQLRVNDRGPFADERIIDISRRGAQLLGFQNQGITRVRVRILADESRRLAVAAGGNPNVVLAGNSSPAPSYAARSVRPADPARVLATPMSAPPTASKPAASPSARPAMSAPSAARAPVIAPARPSAPSTVTAAAAGAPPPPRPVVAALAPIRAAQAAAPPVAQPATRAGSVFVQVGAYSDTDNVQRARTRLGDLGAVQVASLTVNGLPIYRVRLGPYLSDTEADRTLARAVAAGFTQSRVVYD